MQNWNSVKFWQNTKTKRSKNNLLEVVKINLLLKRFINRIFFKFKDFCIIIVNGWTICVFSNKFSHWFSFIHDEKTQKLFSQQKYILLSKKGTKIFLEHSLHCLETQKEIGVFVFYERWTLLFVFSFKRFEWVNSSQ